MFSHYYLNMPCLRRALYVLYLVPSESCTKSLLLHYTAFLDVQSFLYTQPFLSSSNLISSYPLTQCVLSFHTPVLRRSLNESNTRVTHTSPLKWPTQTPKIPHPTLQCNLLMSRLPRVGGPEDILATILAFSSL